MSCQTILYSIINHHCFYNVGHVGLVLKSASETHIALFKIMLFKDSSSVLLNK